MKTHMTSRFSEKIGFMQGRLSEQSEGRIQSFPWGNWKDEFVLGGSIGFKLLEWTIDSTGSGTNPLIDRHGISEIKELIGQTKVHVNSVTSDWFMENPPWSGRLSNCVQMHHIICESLNSIGASILVIPLVDNSNISNKSDEKQFEFFIENLSAILFEKKISVAIESDFAPLKLKQFISRFDKEIVGINYDIGNSAHLGYNPYEEFDYYGDRIINVHVKDRKLGGPTTQLGKGDANFEVVFDRLKKISYDGNYILQTARASERESHSEVLERYASMVEEWIG